MLRRIIWTLVDPLLLRMARRMECLIAEERDREARRFATVDPTVRLYPTAQIRNFLGDPRAITIGAHSHIQAELLVFWDGGSINIGEWCYIAERSRIWSHASISIGNHVLISHLVNVFDTNGHPIDWEARRQDIKAIMTSKVENRVPEKIASRPIVIEDDVWIDFKATVFKGVRIGRGAIVTAGSVVIEDVPPFTVVAGSPARVVRELVG